MAPPAGLEPATLWLTVICSANWAIEEYFLFSYTWKITSPLSFTYTLRSGNYLLSRAVAHQVPSTLRSLTSVFGMGTGGSSLLSSPDLFIFWRFAPSKLNNTLTLFWVSFSVSLSFSLTFGCSDTSLHIFSDMLWSSPRTISTTQLHTLLHFHLWPINQVVFLDPYRTTPWEILSWRGLHA